MPLPSKIVLSMGQHIGAPASPAVAKGDQVYVGTIVGKSGGFVSSDIHSGVSGTVSEITTITAPNGATQTAVVIVPDGEQKVDPAIAPPEVTDYKSFVDAIRASGLVGLGGAGFPTWVKLNATVDRLVINGSECEPYCTVDYIAMRDYAADMAEGVRIVKTLLGIEKAIVGVKHPPKGLEDAFKGMDGVEIKQLREYYPVGAEKMLIHETTGRVVPGGKLPKDAGCIVLNVNTAAFIARYLRTGMPLVSKTVSVDGSAVNTPSVITAPIGTPVGDLFAAAGGFKGEPAKIFAGGPMMGIALPDLDFPLLWNNNGFVALNQKEATKPATTACIRCGRCVDHCPMNLMAFEISKAYEQRDVEWLRSIRADLCIECGCCSYVCPARRDLVTNNKLAKRFLASQPKKEVSKS